MVNSIAMSGESPQIDAGMKRRILEYPMPRLLRILFPGMPVRDRGYMRSPFHVDRHPSFSCFTGRGGVSMGKDFSTDRTYDNISLYMEVFPTFGYVESVDRLCRLLFGRSVFVDGPVSERRPVVVRENPVGVLEPESAGALEVFSARPLVAGSVPGFLVDYWRSRGVSDAVVSSMCMYVEVRNRNRVGKPLFDTVSGLPLCGSDGVELVDDGMMRCIGMSNEIGGYSLRTPAGDGLSGFKGGTSSFLSVFPSCGVRREGGVLLSGAGDGFVTGCRVAFDGRLWINGSQCFEGIRQESVVAASRFVSSFVGTRLAVRDVRRICAVLGCLNNLSSPRVAVVEGMFDAMSYVELFGRRSDTDLVVLNSLGNSRWAIPVLAVHEDCSLYLDDDAVSGAGQKACSVIAEDVRRFSEGVLRSSRVRSCSSVLDGCKDLNELLVRERGRNRSVAEEEGRALGASGPRRGGRKI